MIPNAIKVGVPSEAVFPRGAMVLGVEPETDFDLRGKSDDIQKRDKDTGLRMWVVTVVDMEEPDEARFRRTAEMKVKIAAKHRPVPPDSRVPGYPPLVEFEGLTLTPWLDQQKCTGPRDGRPHRCNARVAYSVKASGMREFSSAVSTLA